MAARNRATVSVAREVLLTALFGKLRDDVSLDMVSADEHGNVILHISGGADLIPQGRAVAAVESFDTIGGGRALRFAGFSGVE